MSDLTLMTDEEAKFFNEQGYLLIRSAFASTEVEELLTEVRRVVDFSMKQNTLTKEEYYHHASFKVSNILRRSRRFDRLIDHPAYFGRLVSLIGDHIQFMGSEIFVRGPAEEAITGFHTDLGEGLQKFLPGTGNPMLQVKAQIFLTDLSEPNSSNFVLIPGSHRKRVEKSNVDCLLEDINEPMRTTGRLPQDAVQVLAKPGDVLLFPWGLWHAVGPNLSGRTRLSITLRFGILALRPMDKLDLVLADLDRTLSARQRRLLGEFDARSNPYKPQNQRELIFNEPLHA